MPQQPLRITLNNDYEIVVSGLHAMLAPYADRVRVVELDVAMIPKESVDVAIYDSFAAADDILEFEAVVNCNRASKVAVYSFSEHPSAVHEAFRRGADGYISKAVTPARLVRAIEQIAAGERIVEVDSGTTSAPTELAWPGQSHGLTAREAEILSLIARGMSNEQIAAQCYLSINTVKSYIRTAYRKASVSTRAQAVGWALRNGFEPDHLRVH